MNGSSGKKGPDQHTENSLTEAVKNQSQQIRSLQRDVRALTLALSPEASKAVLAKSKVEFGAQTLRIIRWVLLTFGITVLGWKAMDEWTKASLATTEWYESPVVPLALSLFVGSGTITVIAFRFSAVFKSDETTATGRVLKTYAVRGEWASKNSPDDEGESSNE